MMKRGALGTVLWAAMVAPSLAADIDRGHEFAAENCAPCHAIERTGDSPLAGAPPFRTLHERYPVDYLAEALAEGIVTGHPDMPQFALEPDEINDILDYIKSLED